MLERVWELFVETMMVLFMPAVCSYFMISGDLFLNVAAVDAAGLEKAGNTLLTPFHYLFAARSAIPQEDGSWEFVQRFEYQNAFWIKSAFSIASLPASLAVGGSIKALSYLSPATRVRHASMRSAKTCTLCNNHSKDYRLLGIPLQEGPEPERFVSQGHIRREGDEKNLQDAKEALREIARVFNEANIPWWVDCGTCLGAYRYGGVIPWDGDIDLAILHPDFENARRALNRLDPRIYDVQDWSSRTFPNTYIKIFVRKSYAQIDIDCFEIVPEKREIQGIFSLDQSIFFPEWFKIRERRYAVPTSYETIFPLKTALFDGVEVFVPNDTKKYLQRVYGENLDPVKVYNPKTGLYEKELSHPYWQLQYAH